MPTDIKEISRRVTEDVWNQRKLEAVDELVAADYVHHDPNSQDFEKGPKGYRELIRRYLTAFSDLNFTIHEQIAEGDTVVSRWTATGTHNGELSGIAPTGRRFEVTGTTTARVRQGKFAESWSNWDALGLMQQLGVVPAVDQAKGRAA